MAVAASPGPKTGQLLVATRSNSHDQEFAQTVVLVIYADDKQAMGLVINRPTDVPLKTVFPEVKTAPRGTDRSFMGGPVVIDIKGLLRSRTKPDDSMALPVFGDVYVIRSKTALVRLVGQGLGPDVFRVYVGYAGWSMAQLQNEIDIGRWRVRAGDARLIFDAHPATLWPRLLQTPGKMSK